LWIYGSFAIIHKNFHIPYSGYYNTIISQDIGSLGLSNQEISRVYD